VALIVGMTVRISAIEALRAIIQGLRFVKPGLMKGFDHGSQNNV
jgi:hypothetical protein